MQRRSTEVAAFSLLALSVLCNLARATDYSVTDSTSFFNAIQSIDAAPTSSDRIILANSFTMAQQVLAITTTGSLTVVGGGNTIDGGGAYRPFFIESGNVTLQNLTITDAIAHGGNAGSEGGGGLGAGAAVFLDSSAHLTIQNVIFTGNAAIGGSGYTTIGAGPGGGGGLGGDGVTGNGGGGGLYGQGGQGDSMFGGGGGGGGELGNGGLGSVGGGGGGGSTGNGSDGSFSNGGAGGSTGGGAGGDDPDGTGTNGTTGGGAGGGTGTGTGGNGGLFGGGGGAGSQGHAGNGGDFGGGGGSSNGTGAGNGGFGGGGGGAYNTSAGNGGFGAGGGGTAGGGSSVYGFGGFGGGDGTASGNGGGGAGFGGAIFAREGATITIIDSADFSSNFVVGGAPGGSGAGTGSTDGNDLFLMRGSTTSFNITAGQTYTFTPAIGNNDGTSNAGVAIDKLGLGTLVLDGVSSYSGTTTVDSGTLVVNSTLAGIMTVNSGGTLMGVGVVGDTTINTGGTIYPGIVGAPLTVAGNFVQNSGTTYSAEVSPTDSDKIIVNGSATIHSGTTFNVVLDAGTYSAGTHYVVLTASGGISGTYTSLIAPDPGSGLFFSLLYDANDIQLIINALDPTANFAAIAQTFNQYQVATALDTISQTAGGDMASYISQLEGLTPSQQRVALDQLSGDIFPSISAIEIQTTSTWIQLINNRIANQFQLASLAERSRQNFAVNAPTNGPDESEVYTVAYTQSSGAAGSAQPMMRFRRASGPKWTGWMQGYGLGGNVASNGNAGALSYGLGGSVFGVDRWMGRNTMVGVLGGYAGANTGDPFALSSTAINGYQVGVYGLHRFERFYALGATAYSGDNYTTNRAINVVPALTAHSSYAGNQFVKYAEIGTMYQLGRTRVMPLMAVQYIYLDQQSFNETGAGVFNLSVGHQTTNSIRPMLGTRLYQEYFWHGLRVVPTAQGRWQRECGDGTHLITSSFAGAPTVAFNTAGNTLGRDFGLFSLGSNVILNSRTSLYGGYDLQVASRYTANMGSAGLQYRW